MYGLCACVAVMMARAFAPCTGHTAAVRCFAVYVEGDGPAALGECARQRRSALTLWWCARWPQVRVTRRGFTACPACAWFPGRRTTRSACGTSRRRERSPSHCADTRASRGALHRNLAQEIMRMNAYRWRERCDCAARKCDCGVMCGGLHGSRVERSQWAAARGTGGECTSAWCHCAAARSRRRTCVGPRRRRAVLAECARAAVRDS